MSFFVYDALPLGKENAVPADVLARRCGFQNVRDLRSEITEEMRNGALVGSCNSGYFRPIRLSEFKTCYRYFLDRARSSFKKSQQFRAAIRQNFEGQMSLDDFSDFLTDGDALELME